MNRPIEHRRSLRLAHPGVACVTWKSRARRYAVGDLSLGGALLLGEPAPRVGLRVEAMLRMRGQHTMALSGCVVRRACSGVRPAFALRFTRMPSEAEDAIHDLWLVDQVHPAAAAVLLVARSRNVRDVLSEFLRRLGWSVATAGTPLEAIEQLECLSERLHWIVAFHHLTQTTGMNLLTYAGAAHPGLRRLLVCPPSVQRLDRLALRRGIAEAAILQPINPPDIATALGRRRRHRTQGSPGTTGD